jgi:hypothetical protein
MARKKRARKTDDEIVYGKEPEFKRQPKAYMSTLAHSLTWYRHCSEDADKKRWLVEWASENTNVPVDRLKRIPDAFCGSLGAFCRILQRGFEAKGKDIQSLKDRIDILARDKGDAAEPAAEAPVIPAAIRKEQKLSPVYTTFDNYIDGNEPILVMENTKLGKGEVAELREHYERGMQDIIDNPKDYNDPDTKIKRYSEVVEQIKAQEVVTKITRTRRKKTVTTDKQVARLNYQKDTAEYGGLVSVNPEKLIGSKQAMLFNTKYRTLQLYVSEDGLGVKGSTLQNFDPEKSYAKKIRVPEAFLPQLTAAMKSVKLLDNVKAKPSKLTGRVNKDTIILKVW